MKCERCNRVFNSHCKDCTACHPEEDYNHRDDCPTLQRRIRRRERERASW